MGKTLLFRHAANGVLIGLGALLVFGAWWKSQRISLSADHPWRPGDRVLRIGYSIERPYAYPGEDGEVTGETVELARLIASRLGVTRIEWRQADFGALIMGLENRTFDVVAADMFITPERARRVAFSDPTLVVPQGLLVRKGNPLGLHGYEDLLSLEGRKVAVLDGAIEGDLLRRMGLPDELLLPVPDTGCGRLEVAEGRAVAFAVTGPTARELAAMETEGAVEAAEPFRQPAAVREAGIGFCAYAFHPDDRVLSEAWNREWHAVRGSWAHLAVLERFGFSAEHVPDGVTAAQVIERRERGGGKHVHP